MGKKLGPENQEKLINRYKLLNFRWDCMQSYIHYSNLKKEFGIDGYGDLLQIENEMKEIIKKLNS